MQDGAMATKKKTTTKKVSTPKKKSSEETKRPTAGKPRNPFGEKQKPTWLDRR